MPDIKILLYATDSKLFDFLNTSDGFKPTLVTAPEEIDWKVTDSIDRNLIDPSLFHLALITSSNRESKELIEQLQANGTIPVMLFSGSCNVEGIITHPGSADDNNLTVIDLDLENNGVPALLLPLIVNIIELDRLKKKLRGKVVNHQRSRHNLIESKVLFIENLSESIKRNEENNTRPFAVFYLGLNRFRLAINSLGHLVGDQLLKMITLRIAAMLRETDCMTRLGSDEFAILLTSLKREKDIDLVAARILAEIEKPFQFKGYMIFFNASIGMVSYGSGCSTAEDMLRNAGSAMNSIRNSGRSGYTSYDCTHEPRQVNILKLESDMRRGIQEKEFVLHFQPVVSLKDGSVTSVEALLRWMHPKKGLIPPLDFIPLAEESGLIIDIGNLVVEQACMQCKRWKDEGFSDLRVAINFSAKQFMVKNWLSNLREIIDKTGASPNMLDIEITESIAMDKECFDINSINEMKRMGIRLSIDDFGTSYSTLSSLKDLPINTLKIDRAFIKDLSTDDNAKAITAAIIAMAHTLGLDVIAEGVELFVELGILSKQQCDKVQGYYFSRPILPDELSPLIKNSHFQQMLGGIHDL